MKIGVSGASGHLGRAVVSELLERADGHEIVAIYRRGRTGAIEFESLKMKRKDQDGIER
jgi:putative NADH-flavin reductase